MNAGSLRAWRPTAVGSERALARFAISSASARFAPSGHSQKTAFPASSALMTRPWCPGTRTTTATRSMSGWAIIASKSWNASSAPKAAAEAFAVSSWAVQTALSSYSGRACSAGTWALAPQPLPPGVTVAPTMPTRIFAAMLPPSRSPPRVELRPVRLLPGSSRIARRGGLPHEPRNSVNTLTGSPIPAHRSIVARRSRASHGGHADSPRPFAASPDWRRGTTSRPSNSSERSESSWRIPAA